jgi:hypothetical protein
MYDETCISAAKGIGDLLTCINTQSGDFYGIFLLASLTIFIMYNNRESNMKASLLATSFIVAIISIPLWAMNIISMTVMIYPVILLFAAVIVYALSE